MTRWFEDINAGDRFELGEYRFELEEIIKFNLEYDNQYFHTDPELAKFSHFGGIIASGWHTACVGQRKLVDALFAEEERLRAEGLEPGVSGPSPGINKMAFKTPVRPGDTISYELSVTGKRISNSIPGWGLLFNRMEATNQRGELVFLTEYVGFSKLRDFKPTLKQRFGLWATKIPFLRRALKR
jgi:acyl dehydratase